MTIHTSDFPLTLESLLSDDDRWIAVKDNDSSLDGRFVYAPRRSKDSSRFDWSNFLRSGMSAKRGLERST